MFGIGEAERTHRVHACRLLMVVGLTLAVPSSLSFAGPNLDDLLAQAQSGDDKAEFVLGLAYEIGKVTAQNYVEAANWYKKAADASYAPAITSLGYLYQAGKGVPEDRAKAADLYEQAAEAGDVRGQVFLALTYTNGLGVPRDARQAATWYFSAAKAGDQQSQLILAMMLQAGKGVKRNEFAARLLSEPHLPVFDDRVRLAYGEIPAGSCGADRAWPPWPLHGAVRIHE
jgi:TPR repeat protein